MLKIRVMNVSKKDLQKTLKRFKGAAWDQSPHLQEAVRGRVRPARRRALRLRGRRTTTSTTARRTSRRLGELAKIAAACHAPFISAAAPSLFGMESWQELEQPARSAEDLLDAGLRRAGARCASRKTRATSASTMPRFLARRPYGAKSDPGRGVRLRRGDRRARRQQVHVGQLRLRHGRQHQPLVQAVRLVLAHPRHRGRRRGRRVCPPTPSRPTTAAWT